VVAGLLIGSGMNRWLILGVMMFIVFIMGHIYRGILPFVFLQVISMAILCLFPAIVTWLPNLFFGS
jgi:TRAP-type mannitol/chloroaromatic compound transport system permease large subunit